MPMKETSYLTDTASIAVFGAIANYISNYLWGETSANRDRRTEERLFTITTPATMMRSRLRRN
jgi:hypothetical protein